ncbi:hypothetical protein BS50DRAFT_496770 [Corynespora cassiicola Philippines]|uniref:Uncharacterized protein n=1 Tax=Corynespora cassiicola Philippines TaxID=1448308 RepID=A0A2T2NJ01_CORCC|nr:hypothetical protein BS50DRAFT_496770 [Corynespora cassiicola Philippines]
MQCTVLAAAPIGAFSWTTIEEAHWLTPGFWYGSLIMSILGILISASEVTVLHILGPLPTTGRQRKAIAVLGRYTSMLLSKEGRSSSKYVARKKMIFVWQCPLMFMSYSVCGFLAGLTTLVCTPLWNRHKDWNDRCNIAVMYLTICGISGAAFVFSSFWIYHYIDLTFEEDQNGHEDRIDTDNEC